jgi:hypothetical protein
MTLFQLQREELCSAERGGEIAKNEEWIRNAKETIVITTGVQRAADWTLTHTSHKDTEQSKKETSIIRTTD